jgi:hypothetical protein
MGADSAGFVGCPEMGGGGGANRRTGQLAAILAAKLTPSNPR